MIRCQYNCGESHYVIDICGKPATTLRSVTADDIDETKRLEGRPMCQEHADRCASKYDKPEWETRYEPIAADAKEQP